MTFFIDNWMLFVVALSSGGMLLWPVLSKSGGSAGINPNEAVQLMNREKAVVVDVCSAEEFAGGHVVGAKNIPLGELEAKLSAAIKNKSTPVILVCASGMRSRRAVSVAKNLGFEKAYSLTGGMGAWRGASLPVQKG